MTLITLDYVFIIFAKLIKLSNHVNCLLESYLSIPSPSYYKYGIIDIFNMKNRAVFI